METTVFESGTSGLMNECLELHCFFGMKLETAVHEVQELKRNGEYHLLN